MNGYMIVINNKDFIKVININKQELKIGFYKNDCNLGIFELDSGDDLENIYRYYSDNVDIDVSNIQDEGDFLFLFVFWVVDRCLLNNLNIVNSVISSDLDSCMEGEFILDCGGQMIDEISMFLEFDEIQM